MYRIGRSTWEQGEHVRKSHTAVLSRGWRMYRMHSSTSAAANLGRPNIVRSCACLNVARALRPGQSPLLRPRPGPSPGLAVDM
jgi:hypothetical protein